MKRKLEVIAADAMVRQVRETVTFESAQELGQHLAASLPPLPDALAELKEWVDSELQKNGWPPIGMKVRFDNDRNWRLVGPDGAPINPDWDGAWSEIFIRDKAKPLSRDYFLALIALEVRNIEYTSAEAPNRETAIFGRALTIGQHMQTMELHGNHLDEVTETKAIRAGRRLSAKMTNNEHLPLREVRFKEMARLVPTLGVTGAAKALAGEKLGSWHAIKRQWDRHKIK